MAAFDEEAVFTCVGFGSPLPTLTWTQVDSDIPLLLPKFEEIFYNMTNEQGYKVAVLQLKIYHSNNNDEGSYKCEGNNSIPNLIGAQPFAIGRFLVEGKMLWI